MKNNEKKGVNSNAKAYEAMVAASLIKGIKLPYIGKIVEEYLVTSGEILKTEEIHKHVERTINLPLDESVTGVVSNALTQLRDDGIIEHIDHGYWQIKG